MVSQRGIDGGGRLDGGKAGLKKRSGRGESVSGGTWPWKGPVS